MKRLVSLLFLLFLASANVVAQCSMCRAVAQTGNGNNGESPAGGLNDAIIYLMIVPYVLLIVFFRKRIWGFMKEIRSMWG